MKYTKPPLTVPQQVDLLLSRGMTADRAVLEARLASVSYYRLSGYWYPFRNPDDTFAAGTTFDAVWRRYTFDRQLRIIVMDAVERIEVAVRSLITHEFVHKHGAFGYVDRATLPNLTDEEHQSFLARLNDEAARSRETFVEHFRNKYGDSHAHLPLWMASELMTFGFLLTFCRGLHGHLRAPVAARFGMPDEVFMSWLRALNAVRNTCAHHGRLWNRRLGYRPILPRKRKHPQWHFPVQVPDHRVFGILTILKHMLNIVAPQSKWPQRLMALLDEYHDIPRQTMGFTDNWRDCPIWCGLIPASDQKASPTTGVQ